MEKENTYTRSDVVRSVVREFYDDNTIERIFTTDLNRIFSGGLAVINAAERIVRESVEPDAQTGGQHG